MIEGAVPPDRASSTFHRKGTCEDPIHLDKCGALGGFSLPPFGSNFLIFYVRQYKSIVPCCRPYRTIREGCWGKPRLAI